jgi:hypothetical protein
MATVMQSSQTIRPASTNMFARGNCLGHQADHVLAGVEPY